MTTEKDPKEMLREHAFFIKNNIVPTEEFWKRLVKNSVLPESMVNEAKAMDTTHKQIEKLMEVLAVNGKTVILKFCDVLQLCNQNYMAQFLRDELAGEKEEIDSVDADAMLRRYPRLANQLDKGDRLEIAKIIHKKVKEILLKRNWEGDMTEKGRAMDAKKRQLEDHFKFTEAIKEKDSMIKQMSATLEMAVQDAASKGVSLTHVSNYINDLKKKHKQDLTIQMQYNSANQSSIQRQQDRVTEMDEALEIINLDIIRHMTEDEYCPPFEVTSNELVRLVNNIEKAKFNLGKLLKRYKALIEIEKSCIKLQENCEYVLAHTGRDANDDLAVAFKGFVSEKEEEMQKLKKDIVDLNSEIERLKNRSRAEESSMVQDLEQILQKVRAESHAKDEKIKNLRSDNDKLRITISKYEKKAEDIRRPSPPHQSLGSHSPVASSGNVTIVKMNNIKPGRASYPNAQQPRYTLPAIKAAQASQGTIQFHKPDQLRSLAPTSNVSADHRPNPSNPIRQGQGHQMGAMIINQVSVPTKLSGPRMSQGNVHAPQKKTAGTSHR